MWLGLIWICECFLVAWQIIVKDLADRINYLRWRTFYDKLWILKNLIWSLLFFSESLSKLLLLNKWRTQGFQIICCLDPKAIAGNCWDQMCCVIFNNCTFLKQSKVYKKIERKLQRFSINPPLPTQALFYYQYHSQMCSKIQNFFWIFLEHN